jgi:hypothetical protein
MYEAPRHVHALSPTSAGTLLSRRHPRIVAMVLAAVITLAGTGVASAATVLDYSFDSGVTTRPGCQLV